MSNYYEPVEQLDEFTKDMARALNCLKQDIESIDMYNQRVCSSNSEDLKAVLANNRDEKIKHVCLTLEWLRQNSKEWEKELKSYLFSQQPIAKSEGSLCWRPRKQE